MSRLIGVIGATLGILLASNDAVQAIYRCHDKEGREVLTNLPTQLERCTPLDVTPSPPPDMPKTHAAPLAVEPVRPESLSGSTERNDTAIPNPTVTLPIQQVGHLFVTTVRLNDEQNAQLIIDTGASHTIISHKLSTELGLYSDSTLGTVTMNTVGGTVRASLMRMKSIRLGEVEVKNSVVVIHDLPDSPPGIEGLLGLSTLQQFQVILDPANKSLSLRPARKEPLDATIPPAPEKKL